MYNYPGSVKLVNRKSMTQSIKKLSPKFFGGVKKNLDHESPGNSSMQGRRAKVYKEKSGGAHVREVHGREVNIRARTCARCAHVDK